ncbi:uncharacterized protein K452DRAFT_233556 [Aplosporella prunicola CBS 121167]|uniref:Uncharacterized protein n=1 Tax=Aplosporella prunicola CBS 121167 TaxID=1176127 RepID=A0A6A6B3L7_9PEZI|nr:uncharacterized protein K452DRAFT_233556 [Aplosporella prunicola CBS 121167]KAF2138799.1 hypothetical protein K452DRAFT_233556 [Aplosporella prunicola CBS 121167]
MTTDPTPAHSKPMVIPTRGHTGLPGSEPQTTRARGQPYPRKTRCASTGDHQANAVPPAVAALLAVTSIPPPRRARSQRRKSPYADKRISIDELIEEWRAEDKECSAGSYGSPLDILLERVDDGDSDDCVSIGDASSKEVDFSSPRSLSSESVPSIPDLDTDERSLLSFSSPSTPKSGSFYRRAGTERKKEAVSPPKEDCILDHPLLHYSDLEAEELPEEPPAPEIQITRQPPTSRLRSAFTSNLTASFQALKSAARSFSNFTAPSIPPDDMLTRSLLSPRFASEMRPKHVEGTPPAALRRYLNPSSSTRPLSPTELSQQLHEALIHGQALEEPSDAPMIQMQTYERRSRNKSRSSKGGRNSSSSSDAASSEAGGRPAVRQREPRENSDFLRVIVLEMNMRRGGKLDAKAMGKARIWLPPRKASARGDEEPAGGVPVRWIGVGVDNDDEW